MAFVIIHPNHPNQHILDDVRYYLVNTMYFSSGGKHKRTNEWMAGDKGLREALSYRSVADAQNTLQTFHVNGEIIEVNTAEDIFKQIVWI